MIAFLVSVNGQRVCLAGIGQDGVLGAGVDWTNRRGFKFHVGGLDTKTDEFADWDTPQIGMDDEITIKIVDVPTVDAESRRFRGDDCERQ
jgi:hypothetical protein